jgi:hypothetical protein
MTISWAGRPIRFFQHLLRETDAIGLDPARLIDEARSVGAGGYIAMGGGFSAWYPSRVAAQPVNPHMSGDFLGDVIAAARSKDVRVLIRMDISKGRSLAHGPADWFVQDAVGAVSTVWDMPTICATGPFWQVETFAILDEMLGRYRADGFFFNYFYVPHCHCERCQRLVRAATGAVVPAAGSRSPAYEHWRQTYLADFTRRMRDFIHARNPSAALVPYHHVRNGWDMRAMAEASDLISSQVSNPVVPNPVDPQPIWNHWAAEEAQLARALKPTSPPILIQTSSEFFASRQTAMPSARLVRNMVQAAAHGANTAPSINGTLDCDDPRFVPALTAFGAYQSHNADWYSGLKSLARVAIVRSESSRLWGLDAGRPAGAPDGSGHLAEFRGVYEMVSDLRYPLDLLVAGGLTEAQLSRYQAVLLPALSCLSQDDAAAVDAYVAEGGKVIATADLAAADENGKPRNAPGLGCLPALPGESADVSGAYLKLAGGTLKASLGGIPHLGVAGPFWSPFAAGKGDCDLRLIGPFANNAPEFTNVEGAGAEPGLVSLAFGRGRAVWLPWRPGALYHRHGVSEYRQLLAALLTEAIGPAPIRSDAPTAVEMTLYGHPRGEILHVINQASTQSKPLIDQVALAGFEIRLRTDATQARLLNGGGQLAASRDGSELVVRIERLDTFAAIAFTSEP